MATGDKVVKLDVLKAVNDHVLDKHTALTEKVNLLREASGEVVITPDMMELGNIGVSSGNITYSENTKRIRTKEGVYFIAYPGDTFKLTDYTNARFSLILTTLGGAKTAGSWRQQDYIFLQTYYVRVVISYYPNGSETVIPDTDTREALKRLIQFTHTQNTADDRLFLETYSNVKGICHRGYSEFAPENSLQSFAAAKKLGFDYVETDISFTADCVPVLVHDATISGSAGVARNPDGSVIAEEVTVAGSTLEELEAYDFGIKRGAEYSGLRVCTLENALKFCKYAGLHLYAEIKTNGTTNGSGTDAENRTANVKTCTDLAKRYGMAEHVTWISFSPALLDIVKAQMPKARLGLVIGKSLGANTIAYVTTGVTDDGTTVGPLKTDDNEVFIDMETASNGSMTTQSDVDALIAANIPLEVYTVNTMANLGRVDGYATGVTTNNLNVPVINWENVQSMLEINNS